LLAFRDFQEEAGRDRVAQGPLTYALREGGGLIARVADGVFGPYAAFDVGQWLHILRSLRGA